MPNADERELIQRLLWAGRRFASEWHAKWVREYDGSGARSRPTSDEAKNLYPRYLAHAAVLQAIEGFTVEDFETLAQAREGIAEAARKAEDFMTPSPAEPIERAATDEERARAATHLATITEQELANVAPLPFRRVLRTEEVCALRRRMRERWGTTDGYWFPIDGPARSDLMAWSARGFAGNGGHEALRAALLARGISRLFELREFGPSHQLETCALEPWYDGAEAFWFSDALDWVVYASHESSITLGGEWLIAALVATTSPEARQTWRWLD